MFWVLGVLLGASVGWGGPIPGGVDIEDLSPTRDWQLVVDGQVVESASIYYSDYEVAWLVRAADYGVWLISPRGNSVQSVSAEGLVAKSDSTARLKAGSALRQVATFEVSLGVMSFEVDGVAYGLRPAPPLLGRQGFGELENRHPTFKAKALAYRQKAESERPLVKSLPEDLVVRVYFGSWSPICERIVPKLIALEKEWADVRFEYYGLPKVIPDDEVAREAGVTGVPTVVVLRSGEEVRRFTGRQLDDPAGLIGSALVGG